MGAIKKDIGLSKAHVDLMQKATEALKKTSEKLIAETKKNNSYIIVSDKDGNIKKIPAKDL